MAKRYQDMTAAEKEKHLKYVKEWQSRNKDKVKQYQQRSRIATKYRHTFIRELPGLSANEFYSEVVRQNERCLICCGKPRRLRIWLDPEQQKFKGLICTQCWLGLQKFNWDRDNLRRAADFAAMPAKDLYLAPTTLQNHADLSRLDGIG